MKPHVKIHLLIIGLMATAIVGCASIPGIAPSGEGELVQTDVKLDPVPPVNSAYKGRRVAVVSFPDKTILSSYPWLRPWLGRASTDLLVEFLLQAGFRVVGGKDELNAIVEELELTETGLIDPAKAARIGKLLGTELLFVGSITDYGEVIGGGKRSVGYGGYGVDIGGQTLNYNVQVAGRLVNVETREILASATASQTQQFKVGGGTVLTPHGRAASQDEIRVRQETAGRVFQKALNDLTIKIVNRVNPL